MRYRGLILMIPLLLLAARAFAKEDSIKIITVYRDDFTRESLKPRVTIMNTDSVPLHVYKTTKYADNVKSWYMEATERLYDAYILRAELKGYETTYETISIQKEDRKRKVKELSGLLMQRSVTQLKEVAVEASKVLMVYKGDTIIYDATAFNLADGSMLDGLIRALPGATIENGKILPCERIGQQFCLGEICGDKVKLDPLAIVKKYNERLARMEKTCKSCYNKKTCSQCMYNLEGIDDKPKCNGFMDKKAFQTYYSHNMSLISQRPSLYKEIMTKVFQS